jgi:hypothetical protein
MLRAFVAGGLIAVAGVASAQIAYPPLPAGAKTSGVFNVFPTQNPNGPQGAAFQTNYPYPGQCVADGVNAALFPGLGACAPASGSFAGFQRTASDWADQTGVVTPFKTLNPVMPPALAALPPAGQLAPVVKFRWPVLNPPDYSPDQSSFPGADYYVIGVHEAWGFDAIAKAGLFPNPGATVKVPNGMQWTGLTCNIAAGCACPADASASFKATYCSSACSRPAPRPRGPPTATSRPGRRSASAAPAAGRSS